MNLKSKHIIFFSLVFASVIFFLYKDIFFTDSSRTDTAQIVAAGFENKNPEELKTQKIKEDSSSQKSYMQIHDEAILVDTHNDFVWKVFDNGAVFGERNSFTQSDLPRFKEGGVDVQVFAVWIPVSKSSKAFSFTLGQIERLKNMENASASEFEFAETYDDIIRITNEKKLCGLIGIEGGTVIGNNLDNINKLYEMGVRYIGLTWNNSNSISTSAKDESETGDNSGLTEFGAEVVKRMNETGMLIDVSHLSGQGFWDVIEKTNSPVIASHSNCYSINPHYRNLTDDQIKAIAKNGGYIGINFYDKFLDKDGERNGSDIEKVMEHINHIKNLVGVDCIGIGADYDGGITPARELYDVTCYPLLTKKLLENGYTESDVKKILGENFLKVFKRVCG